jgi:hypothetical protein
MAIVSFWSGDTKETGQTLSAAAIATHMAIEHNYRMLLVDATFNDDTMERCFWKVNDKKNVARMLNMGKIDISSGAEGLVSAVASNKATPEIITNYTRVVFKNRLDVLCGLKTKIPEEFNKSLMLYKDLVHTADKYYDLVFIDLEKTLKKDTTRALLEASQLIIYNFSQNLKQCDLYIEDMTENASILKKDKVIPLLSRSDDASKYNVRNVSRYIKEKREMATVAYNSNFMEAASEAGVANFFLKTRISSTTNDKNSNFIKSVEDVCSKIDYKLEELKYKL